MQGLPVSIEDHETVLRSQYTQCQIAAKNNSPDKTMSAAATPS
jgi:hypothetical protein